MPDKEDRLFYSFQFHTLLELYSPALCGILPSRQLTRGTECQAVFLNRKSISEFQSFWEIAPLSLWWRELIFLQDFLSFSTSTLPFRLERKVEYCLVKELKLVFQPHNKFRNRGGVKQCLSSHVDQLSLECWVVDSSLSSTLGHTYRFLGIGSYFI
jgi:hypothetical protein